MKIVFFVQYNDNHVADIEQKILSKSLTNYEKMLDLVLFESTNFFAPFVDLMREEGHEVTFITPNIRIVQEQWAKENNADFDKDWQFTIPELQVKSFKPDIFYTTSNFEYYTDFLENIKPHVGRIFAWISCPFDRESLELKHVDHIFTLFEPHYDYFKSIGKSCTLTHAVFDHKKLPFLDKDNNIEVSFVGGIGGYHRKREEILKELVKKTPIKLWGYGFKSKNPIKNVLKQMKYLWIFTKRYEGEAWGKDMLNVMSNSKITFNAHGDISYGHAVNMRLFEATGVGTLLITEDSPSIRELFIPGEEIICYTSAADAVEKINYYLANEEERLKIAKAGQKRTLENYTFEHLTPQYLKIFEEKLAQNEKQFSKFTRPQNSDKLLVRDKT
ncbi:glycosyltransferase [Paracrocinitomix mangrovi]|uniref:CgeB family protein n=1 Tax=Paracrocinitomix mangrovi TaxID=2862509 RepID=UPI001C8D065D|nr:glycosyltransferase [Paracrocinitomix mangrovi]UKN01237.1 glycosyltransferase [Paracrocinitomix mangrovi]